MSMFHSVPGVPRAKMERFAGVDTQTCASPQRGCPKDFYEGDGFWGEVIVCLSRTQVSLRSLNEQFIKNYFSLSAFAFHLVFQ